jgi:hypothetical protein
LEAGFNITHKGHCAGEGRINKIKIRIRIKIEIEIEIEIKISLEMDLQVLDNRMTKLPSNL